ncbi:hypothetical protein ACXZ65_34375 [Streptomyces aculeolatus]
MPKTERPDAAAAESKLLSNHADDIAFVAGEAPATTLEEFVRQLRLASIVFAGVYIRGSADLDAAANLLAQVGYGGEAQRYVLLTHAADHLRDVGDLTEEYRLAL